jgi:predicted aconitase
MQLTPLQQSMLAGDDGPATRKAMEILSTLGKIYDAERLIPVTSVQISGVSYDNLGEAGLSFLSELADGGGHTRVLATLNPAGMDVENWEAMGISPEFAAQQKLVLDAFTRMGVVPTCTCTPYLTGNTAHLGESIAWAESSAVCYANSVLGARTNREGGPSALAAALTGFTAEYGLHLPANRRPTVTVEVAAQVSDTVTFGALGKIIGDKLEAAGKGRIPYILGIHKASLEALKSFCASIATYGGVALFHMPGITPEASLYPAPQSLITVSQAELDQAISDLTNASIEEVDFISLGCPHLSIAEIARLAELLKDKQVKKTFWITTSRPVKQIADQTGYTQIIENSGAIITADTCCVVAPIRGRFKALATDSAKACYYAASKNKMRTLARSFEDVVAEATR